MIKVSALNSSNCSSQKYSKDATAPLSKTAFFDVLTAVAESHHLAYPTSTAAAFWRSPPFSCSGGPPFLRVRCEFFGLLPSSLVLPPAFVRRGA